MSAIQYNHKMAAHCETGTVAALLNHSGMDITEPMVFGIAGGIFFGYFKTSQFTFPTFIVRSKPGQIRKNIEKLLGVNIISSHYKDPLKAEAELDKLLDKGIPVAVQVDFFYMDYLPAWQRVHINVHFVTIIGRNGSKYLLSDIYYPKVVEIEKETLRKGRFAGGSMAPKGFMFLLNRFLRKLIMKKRLEKA